MENKHAVQHQSKERFKVDVTFLMPCRARKLCSQVGDREGIFVARQSSGTKESARGLHRKTTNRGSCPSKFARVRFCCWCVALHRTSSHAAKHTLRVLLSTPRPCCIKAFMYFTPEAFSTAVGVCVQPCLRRS